MRFFTRAWRAKTQSEDATLALWTDAFHAYDAHVNSIRDQFPAALRRFSGLSFHDAELVEATLLPSAVVRVTVNGFRKSRSSKRGGVAGRHEITLKNVTAMNLKPAQLGQYWLYEEVDLAGRGFRLSVLLDDGSIAWFVFEKLAFKTVK